ncbi:MAG: AMP-binding protein [Pseudomonadota bacterium]
MGDKYAASSLVSNEDDSLTSVQLNKLQPMLEAVLQNNHFYREKLHKAGIRVAQDIQSIDDFRRLPFTLKSELSQDQAKNPPYGTNLTFPLAHYIRIHQTSGTTGEPLKMLDTAESWDWWAKCWTSVYRAAGVTAEDRIFFAFSFGPFIGFWSAFAGAQKLGALAISGGGMSSRQRAKAIENHRATVLVCTPTYALHLAEVAQEDGIDTANTSIRITIQAGEPGASLPAVKRRIEQAWGARCYDHAGSTEVGAWGFEREGTQGLQLNDDEFIFEVIDPETGASAQDGELVITNLGRIGLPVIRYRTGDRVKMQSIMGADGHVQHWLDGGVIGRIDDLLVVRGINVFPSAIENIVRKFPEVGEFAVDVYRKNELDEIEMRLEIKGPMLQEVAAAVAETIHNKLSLRVNTMPVAFGSLPLFNHKARRFTDHRKDDGLFSGAA